MKHLIAGSLIALTVAAASLSTATPASALNIHVGPRGVGVGIGHRGVRRGRRVIAPRVYRGHRFHRHGRRHHF